MDYADNRYRAAGRLKRGVVIFKDLVAIARAVSTDFLSYYRHNRSTEFVAFVEKYFEQADEEELPYKDSVMRLANAYNGIQTTFEIFQKLVQGRKR